MTKILVTKRNLLGNVAKCAVMQSPYHRPDNLEVVLDKLNELTREISKNDASNYCKEFDSIIDLKKWLKEILTKIPEFLAWNERENGGKGFSFVSARSQPHPDNDFIDLDALYRNVATGIFHE